MKKILGSFFAVALTLNAMSQKVTSYAVLENNTGSTVIRVETGAVQQVPVTTPSGKALKIKLEKGSALLQKAAPDLPKLSFSIVIPNQKNSEIEIIESHYTDYQAVDIAPSKGRLLRNTDPASIPYTYGEIYQNNAFFPSNLAALNQPYVLRDFRGQTVEIHPVQYNPVSKVLRVYSDLTVRVNYAGSSTVNALTAASTPSRIDEVFDGIYENQFINYRNLKKLRYSPVTEDGSLLILCPASYLSEITPFVKWKEMKGFRTFLVNTDTISGGVNENTIAAVAKYYYQNMQIANMIIVGDNTSIPSVNESFTNPDLSGPSDIAYAYINNGDHYPEFIVGRLSGESAEEIRNIVNRSIAYEKTPNTNGNWMGQQLGIASEQGTGDDNQYDFEHIHDIVDSNKNQYNYLGYYELYDGVSSQGWSDAAGYPDALMFENNVNSGVSLINYAGHGSTNGIVTTGFSSSEVPLLTNSNKLPFMFVVGCSPGRFHSQSCFAETLIRAGSSSNPLGTLSSFMSCIDQYWDEPMQAQDEFNALMRGARPNNLKTRLGAMCVNACCSMNDQYNTFNDPTGGSDMTDTWIFFGDPTIPIYNKNRGALSCTHTAEIGRNASWYSVNCAEDGATIGLYYEGKFLASSKVNGGVATFNFPAVLNLDTIFITATKQNFTPYMGYTKVVDFPANVNDVAASQGLSVYPNPAIDFTNVSLKNNGLIDALTVTDIKGAVVLNADDIRSSSYSFSTGSFAKGQYMVQVYTAGTVIIYKLTKE
jgi:gingipain R